jgi:hypothetical protein
MQETERLEEMTKSIMLSRALVDTPSRTGLAHILTYGFFLTGITRIYIQEFKARMVWGVQGGSNTTVGNLRQPLEWP